MSTKPKSATKPLPLPDLLQDLAVLRLSGNDIAQLFQSTNEQGVADSLTPVDEIVSASSEFVQVSRAAIRLHDSGEVGSLGVRIEEVRSKYEVLLEGLQK
jgi:hypothetical protein